MLAYCARQRCYVNNEISNLGVNFMYVQVLTLARKLGQALQLIKRAHYFRIKHDCRCLFVCVWCVYVRARACCTSFPKITSIISSSAYCKNLLDEVVMESKLIFWQFQYSVKFGLLRRCYHGWRHKIFKGLQNSYSRGEIWKGITRASAGLTTEE